MRLGACDHLEFGALLSGAFNLWIDGAPAALRLTEGDSYLLL